ncbi:MAG TPA: M56 family metallopeptidase [Trebonia sp.]|jgi:Zn-dependent protease with chaperone function|nr:M56 family metallopeptidase [Trebonia sp.]
MTAAFALLGYAIVAAWCAPALLARLTGSGASVRPALAAWLSAMASVLVSAALGAAFMARTGAADWPTLTRLLCQQAVGTVCTPQVYGSAVYLAGVDILAVLIPLAALVAAWRYGRRTRRAVTRTRLHARAAWLAGRELAGTGAVVLDDPRPVAYCVAGRPAAIVVSSGALAVLDNAQLAAVLAHERAHLAGRHHLLATITLGLAAAVPGVPLFTRGADEVARLAELAADDRAARSAGRRALVAALLAIATGSSVPGASVAGIVPVARGALAATGFAVPARVDRLLHPPRAGVATMLGLVLALVSGFFLLLPAALAAVAG